MRVRVDEDLCTGHGRCYALAPEVFAPDDRGHCLILVEEVPEGERWDAVRDRIKRAASAENIVTYDQDIAAWVADFGDEGEAP